MKEITIPRTLNGAERRVEIPDFQLGWQMTKARFLGTGGLARLPLDQTLAEHKDVHI